MPTGTAISRAPGSRYAATGDDAVHAAIAAEAAEARVFLNVVDRPRALQLHRAGDRPPRCRSRSRSRPAGASPALAKRLAPRARRRSIGPEWGLAARVLGTLRTRLGGDAAARARIFTALADEPLLAALRARRRRPRRRAPRASTSVAATTLADLGIALDGRERASAMDLVLLKIALVAYLAAAVGLEPAPR